MQTTNRPLLAVGLVALAVLLLALAALYAFGVIGFLSRDPGAAHHPTHAIVLGVLAVTSLIAANFVRPKTA